MDRADRSPATLRRITLLSTGCAALLAACSPTAAHPTPTSVPPSPSPPSDAPSPTASAAPVPSPTPLFVPTEFSPLSVTFVSSQTGWVLGWQPCPTRSACLALRRTDDSGHTWLAVQPPPAPLPSGANTGVRQVRFADVRNGWVFGPDLWATHDGGEHWTRQAFATDAGNSQVSSLETSGGAVDVAIIGSNGVQFFSSPAATDSWTASATTIQMGAGPVPQAQIVLHGSAGWAIEVDRTVVSGARLSGGRWVGWQPPCSSAGGSAALAAGTMSQLVAVCNEGTYTGPTQSVHVYFSGDGGSSFRRVATALPLSFAGAVTMSPSAGTVIVGGNAARGAVLLASFNGGAGWTTVYRGGDSIASDELGFTTTSQGVAIVTTGNIAHLLMTYDGGRSWRVVSFG
jgi:hypothetical protein